MIDWWTSLSSVMKVLWGLTLTSSLVFVIQSVMTFLGADSDASTDGIDADFDDPSSADGSGSSIYTFRNLVNFCLGFGWTSVLFHDKISSLAVLYTIATLVGVALVAIVFYLIKWLYSMQQSGNINVYTQAVGCQGKVYLTIPGERAGVGKVQISINSSVREYDAVTDSDTLPTGTSVKVIEVVDASTLLVEQVNSLII